jgi:hypothetical protein
VQKTADIKPGERIVVVMTESKDASGKALLTAKEIRLGPQTTTNTEGPPQKHATETRHRKTQKNTGH